MNKNFWLATLGAIGLSALTGYSNIFADSPKENKKITTSTKEKSKDDKSRQDAFAELDREVKKSFGEQPKWVKQTQKELEEIAKDARERTEVGDYPQKNDYDNIRQQAQKAFEELDKTTDTQPMRDSKGTPRKTNGKFNFFQQKSSGTYVDGGKVLEEKTEKIIRGKNPPTTKLEALARHFPEKYKSSADNLVKELNTEKKDFSQVYKGNRILEYLHSTKDINPNQTAMLKRYIIEQLPIHQRGSVLMYTHRKELQQKK